MRNSDVERRLFAAVEHAVPDVLEDILERKPAPGAAPAREEPTRRRAPAFRRRLAAAMAMLVLLAGALTGHYELATYAVVDLDVNPSMELRLNRAGRVIRARALNADAESLVEGMDLRGATVEVAVNALIGAMLTRGYIDELANSVLISVSAPDAGAADALRGRAEQAARALLQDSAVDGAVVSQLYRSDEAERLGEAYGASPGRIALMQVLIAENPVLSYDALGDLTVNELNLILSSKTVRPEGVSVEGTVSLGRFADPLLAIDSALAARGLTRGQVDALTCEMDVDYGRVVYEVEYEYDHHEYEYTLDAVTLEILEWEAEWEHPAYRNIPDG